MDKNNLPVLYSCLLCSVVFASLFLPFLIAFFITFNQNNSKNRQTANAKKLTGAEDRLLEKKEEKTKFWGWLVESVV